MEVVVAEKKKKIFCARKTMKISNRQQLETLHSTLLTANPSPPPLLNGTHKEDGHKVADKEQTNSLDSNSPSATSPASRTSQHSPTPSLSLNLSPSPPSSESPKEKEENPSASPFHSINVELKKMEEEEQQEKKASSAPSLKDSPTSAPIEAMEQDSKVITEKDKKEEAKTVTEGSTVDSVKDSVKDLDSSSPVPPAVSSSTEPMETESDTPKAKSAESATAKVKVEKPPSKASTSASSAPCPSSSRLTQPSGSGPRQKKEIKEGKEQMEVVKNGLKTPKTEGKSEIKKEKSGAAAAAKSSRPSSTPPADTVLQGRGSGSGLKRTLSEGNEDDGKATERDGKRPKMEGVELEAQLELKITAKASSRHKLEKIVQQLVDERLKVLELTVFDKNLQDLKTRVDKVECSSKHQMALNTLQAKIARLAKKFGEANQMSENKRKQEALAAAAAAAATAAAKTLTVANTSPAQRQARTSMELKQNPTILSASSTLTTQAVAPTSTSTMVSQGPILQLITSTASAGSNLAGGITSQSPTGTLLLKPAPGSGMMTTGQPLLIQLPLSMTNGQAGTLVNIPVSSLSAANSLGKTKTSTTTATFIIKQAPITTTATASAPAAVTVSALQGPQLGQISLARTVYQGGAGAISTPNAGVSVTTARTPVQTVSAAGAMSSTSSPATSGPAATGSTAPGPPQGTSLTSKTDNQATGSTPAKPTAPGPRPKGSVIDLTEDDDDVQGVQNATVTPASTPQRPHPVVSFPSATSTGARSSPQINQSAGTPHLTVHHRPPVESPVKSRLVTTATPSRGPTMALPPLPSAPLPANRLPPEAAQTSPPQQPQLKLVPSQTGIVLSWCVAETDRSCAAVDSYHLYAFHQDSSNSSAAQQHWKKIGEVNALPLPMACTLTQFQSGSTYHFAVRAKDIYGRFGSFCEPQCTNVINSTSS
ncbi:activating transcription factor 7-interacting protein 1 isoform X2 [Genypterus blacodes]|uniref:activating transcription factor 7-interacting protein 1 isoform X2 n=1 Tax=Genypterus blacodes TaxID=154954 RepID=UPI003F7773E5